MKNYHFTNFENVIIMASMLVLLSMQSMNVIADVRNESAYNNYHNNSDGSHYLNRKMKRIHGFTVTGVNSVLGKPFFNWGDQYGGTFNFPTMGVFNKGGTDPLPLDANTPESAILASYIDPIYLFIAGKPADYVVNPEWVNVPLRDVAVNTDFAFVEKRALRDIREAEILELSQSKPADDITLGQWMEASGVATIKCSGDGADIKLRMRNLIPNRMYSVWANMGLPPQSDSVPTISPIPLGGAPNMFLTNEDGDAIFKRWVKFCPIDPQSTNSSMLNIDVYFHANQQNYGAVIAPGFWKDGEWPGVITFSHIVFPINVELLDN